MKNELQYKIIKKTCINEKSNNVTYYVKILKKFTFLKIFHFSSWIDAVECSVKIHKNSIKEEIIRIRFGTLESAEEYVKRRINTEYIVEEVTRSVKEKEWNTY